MIVKHFLREKIVDDIKKVGCLEWAKNMLYSEDKLAIVFSGEIEETLFFGKDVERPIGIIRDRLSAFLTGNRLGDIRLIQFTTLRKMQSAADTNDAQQFLQTLLSGFHSEKSDQYYSRNSRNAAISKSNVDDSIYFDDHVLELELQRNDAKKIAKIDSLNTKKKVFRFWLENFNEEDFDEEWFERKCTELGFDISDILNGYTKKAINVERAASGNSQLVLVF
jgi:hypothetical protein